MNILIYAGETQNHRRNFCIFVEKESAMFGVFTDPVQVYGTGERATYFAEMYFNPVAPGIYPTEIDGIWNAEISSTLKRVERPLGR